MKIKEKKHSNVRQFAMAVNANAKGCGCPECAAEKNATCAESEIQDAIKCLKKLVTEDRLMVWDPASRKCLSGSDIEHICVNGDCVQIGLSETALAVN